MGEKAMIKKIMGQITGEKATVLAGNFFSVLIFGLLPMFLINLTIRKLYKLRTKRPPNVASRSTLHRSITEDYKHYWEAIICNVNCFSGGVFVDGEATFGGLVVLNL